MFLGSTNLFGLREDIIFYISSLLVGLKNRVLGFSFQEKREIIVRLIYMDFVF